MYRKDASVRRDITHGDVYTLQDQNAECSAEVEKPRRY